MPQGVRVRVLALTLTLTQPNANAKPNLSPHQDYEGLASVPSAVLPGYGGKPWHLVPSLLEDRLTGSTEGTEWGRRDNVSADGAVTKFGQIDAHKDKEAKVRLE